LRDCVDYDLALRAFEKGVSIYYSEDAFGWHDDFPTSSSFIKRQLEYKAFNEILVKNDPGRNSHLLKTRLNKPTGTAKILFKIFKSNFWISAIEQNKLLFLPKEIRYKLYTWIITAHSTYKEYL